MKASVGPSSVQMLPAFARRHRLTLCLLRFHRRSASSVMCSNYGHGPSTPDRYRARRASLINSGPNKSPTVPYLICEFCMQAPACMSKSPLARAAAAATIRRVSEILLSGTIAPMMPPRRQRTSHGAQSLWRRPSACKHRWLCPYETVPSDHRRCHAGAFHVARHRRNGSGHGAGTAKTTVTPIQSSRNRPYDERHRIRHGPRGPRVSAHGVQSDAQAPSARPRSSALPVQAAPLPRLSAPVGSAKTDNCEGLAQKQSDPTAPRCEIFAAARRSRSAAAAVTRGAEAAHYRKDE